MTTAAAAAAAFSPASVTRLHAFPPFFTLQPVDASRATQLEAWGRLVLAFCAHRGQPRFALGAPESLALFENAALDPPRRLPEAGVRAVAEALVAAGRAEWADEAARSTLLVFVRPPAELAVRLEEFLRARGATGISRLVDLRSDAALSDGTWRDSPCAGLDGLTALRVLEVLERDGKVDLDRGDEERPDPDSVQIVRFRP
jgi:ESCRT-II complex subunit VPS25